MVQDPARSVGGREFPPGVHKLASTRGAYAYLVVGEASGAGSSAAVLIDTGLPGRAAAILSELAALGVGVLSDIVLTHGDVDHMGNFARLLRATGARGWIPAGDRPYILGLRPRPGVKRVVGAVVHAEVPAAAEDLYDGDCIGRLVAVASPGHTPGHLAFRGPGFLAVGDALTFRAGRVVPSGGLMAWNASLARESASRLLGGFTGWVLPAHGEPAFVGGRP